MSNKNTKLDAISSFVSQITIEGVSLSSATMTHFLNPLSNFVTSYKQERLENRILLFLGNGNDYISEDEVKKFINSLKGNDRDIMGGMIEKVFHAHYDLHVYIYRFIYQRYLKYEKLDYYDHALFSGMEQFINIDFEIFWLYVYLDIEGIEKRMPLNGKVECSLFGKGSIDMIAIKKFISNGLLEQNNIKAENKETSPYGYQEVNIKPISLNPTGFILNEYMYLLYKEIDNYFDNDTKKKIIKDRGFENFKST